jgi:uncharacterized protein YkwD
MALGGFPSDAAASHPAVTWAASTESPRPLADAALDATERAALRSCGPGDAGLAEAARTLAEHRAAGEGLADQTGIAFAQRAAGEPHPWARAWAATGASLDPETTGRAVGTWLQGASHAERRRCGVGSARASGGARTLVVLAAEAMADLAPLPTRVRLGQWLTVEARLTVAATGGRVLVAGSTGVPREIPTWFDGSTLRARFAPSGAGPMTVQVVAELANGPRPVLEATVFADQEPSTEADRTSRAPGEDAATCRDAGDASCQLAAMLTAARASEGLSPLARDASLDALARAHATRIAHAHELAHDAGDGSPLDRLRAAGVDASDVTENLVHADSVRLAHRALWASPSHRANMLLPRMERVGVGVAEDESGGLWAVELETAP